MRTDARVVPKPRWVARFEHLLASAIPVHPNLISLLKVALLAVLIAGLAPIGLLPLSAAPLLSLYLGYALLDYLDGVVARGRNLQSSFGRIFDRVTDAPLLVALALVCIAPLPLGMVLTKIALDLLLVLLYLRGRGSTENRLRTTLSSATSLALLGLAHGIAPRLFSVQLAAALLWLNISLNALVLAVRLGLLSRTRVADGLSALNLCSGLFSCAFALQGRYAASLLLLVVGALCDGLDGAAARRWGGSRWGVLADDIADAVSYGLAPAVALVVGVGGIAGLALGVSFALCTWGRLLYFTLEKGEADPESFSGLPSTAGALLALCALLLFGAERPALIGLIVGIACSAMTAFSVRFRHLGRWLLQNRRIALGAVLGVGLAFTAAGWLIGAEIPAAVLLAASVAYALQPAASRMGALIGRRLASGRLRTR